MQLRLIFYLRTAAAPPVVRVFTLEKQAHTANDLSTTALAVAR